MATLWITGALGVAAFIYFMYRWIPGNRSSFKEITAGRTPLSGKEFAEKFFEPGVRETARRVREQLNESTFPYDDASLVYPDDKLYEPPMYPEFGDGLCANEFISAIEREFKVKIDSKETEHMRTLRELVDYIEKAKRATA